MKKLVFLVLVTVAGSLMAEEIKKLTREDLIKMTPKQRRAYVQMISDRKTGGNVTKPNSAQGVVKIVSAVSFDTAALLETLEVYESHSHLTIKVEKGDAVTPQNAFLAKSKVGAQAAVFIVDVPDLPRVLVGPEEGWAIVNAGALKVDNPDAAVLSMRLTKESLRALAFVGGMGQASKYIEILGPVRDLKALDRIERLTLRSDAIRAIPNGLEPFGVIPATVKVYGKACEEGWAPQPTNDVQRAIWARYHTIPTRPMTIEPEKK